MLRNRSVPMILLSLMICTFSIGTTEYVVMGILTQISTEFDISVASAGQLVTMYAISVAVFGPLLTIVTVKWPRKPFLIMMLGLFIVSNVVSAFAPTFSVLLLSRLASGVMHASFFGLAMVIASEAVTHEKRSFAIASVQGGLTIAVMLGVPFGSFIGGVLSWRVIFLLIALLGLVSLIGILCYVPDAKRAETPSVKKEIGAFRNAKVLFPLAITIFGYAGVFTLYTFIEPLLHDITGFGVSGVTAALFCFGLGGAIGNFLSGRIPQHALTKGLLVVMGALTVILVVFTAVLHSPIGALLIVLLFGMGAFGTVPILQTKIINGAKGAPTLAATSSASAFNVANAGGAWLGGIVLHAGFGFTIVSFVGALITTTGFMLTWLSKRVDRKEEKHEELQMDAS